jgi:putative flippase GtrA
MRDAPWLAALTSHIPPEQFGRYLLVGIWNTFFGYGTFAAATAFFSRYTPYSYVAAFPLSSLVNVTVAFLGYKWFVFRTTGNYLREWARCVAVYSSGVAIAMIALPLIVAALQHAAGLRQSAPYVAGALVMGFSLMYNFLGHKRFSFR